MEDLMKVHNHGTIHQYSFCGCQVKNFQSFAHQISIHARPIFEGCFDSYFPKYGLTLLKFAQMIWGT